jgi:hypothetical protein
MKNARGSGIISNFLKVRAEPGELAPLVARTYYRHPKHPEKQVVLFGITHLAHPDFYAGLQYHLEQLDVVLAEGLDPDEKTLAEAKVRRLAALGFNGSITTRPPKSKKGRLRPSTSPLINHFQMVQELAQETGLACQLSHLDYEAFNAVHADIGALKNPKEYQAVVASLKKAQTQKIDSFSWGVCQAATDFWMAQAKLPVTKAHSTITGLLISMMVRLQFDVGDEITRSVIGDRNKVAMRYFDRTLKRGRHSRIGILYGVAHCQDLHDRLARRGWRKTIQRWAPVWVVR